MCFQGGVTPLLHSEWERALRDHPDRAFANYICTGLRQGFRIGFSRTKPLRRATRNMLSATQHPEPVAEYLAKELRLNRMLGPFVDDIKSVHVSRFGVIPKGHGTGKWRLITDLSHPSGSSVNDGIDPNLCSLHYTSVEDVATVAAQLGRGALLAKIDIESAYRLIPVHPGDRWLLGMKWEGRLYVDPMLPFGLRSSAKIFNAVADALEWRLKAVGVPYVHHYLDDFVVLGAPGSDECPRALEKLLFTCSDLGIPLAAHKSEGPASSITFLGIVIDTLAGELRLPAEKLNRIRTLLVDWGDKKSCTRKDLESLIGHLSHACKVIRPGRSFLRRMIDLLHHSGSAHHIRLNRSFRSDLQWWRAFATTWNGISYLATNASSQFASDASGTWGCGAWHGSSWFQWQWGVLSRNLDIAVKELLPILLAVLIWGPAWRGQSVLCYCDNQAVVAILRSRSCKQQGLMHMLRCLFFIEAAHNFKLVATHISSGENNVTDDLSRDNLHSFFSKVPTASRNQEHVPETAVELLLDPEGDWTSPTWMHRFANIFTTV